MTRNEKGPQERPILFSAPMVRALLAGTKTQTRRVVKPYDPAPSIKAKPVPADLEYLPDFTTYRSTCPYGKPGDHLWVREAWAPTGEQHGALYRCDFPEGPLSIKFKPSIHMPRVACRLLLEVTDVRVERLQNISEADAEAEGAERRDAVWPIPARADRGTHRAGFEALWESINGPASWAANPWVWVVHFRRIQP